MDHSPIEVHQVPRQPAELTRPQAQRDRQDKEGRQTLVRVTIAVEAEFGPTRAAGRFAEIAAYFGDLGLIVRLGAAGKRAVSGGGMDGTAIDLGESVAQAAVRETREEAGIECAITGLVGIYSDPRHVILYTGNGEARQEFSIVLTA